MNLVEDSEPRRTGKGISSRVWDKLSKTKSTAAFIEKFLTKRTSVSLPANDEERKAYEVENILYTRYGNAKPGAAAQVAGMMAPNDRCEPKLSSVKIEQKDPSILLWPTCTKLNRCAGCCGSSIFACVPTRTVKKSMQVMECKPTRPGSDDFNVVGIKSMEFEEHLECECQCKTKVHHCDLNKHTYIPHECRCKCKNEQEAGSCPTSKKWDDKTCGCVCRNVPQCHPDETFSQTSCRCEMSNTASNPKSSGSRNPCTTFPNCRPGYTKAVRQNRCQCVVSSSTMRVAAGRRPIRRPGK